MIKSVIRCRNDMVIVFDEKGKQVSEYQGYYNDVREKILKNTPPDTHFSREYEGESDLIHIPREEW